MFTPRLRRYNLAPGHRLQTMDNSGRGPLRVPGFGDIPVDYLLPVDARFAQGFSEWRQSPPVTAQELAMVALMEWLTDKPSWFEDVFDDNIVVQWRAELDQERHRFTRNPRLLRGDKTWDWCVEELRDKAIDFKKYHCIRVLDTGSCVFKVDPAKLASPSAVLRRAFDLPIQGYTERDERRQQLHVDDLEPTATKEAILHTRRFTDPSPYAITDPMDPDYFESDSWAPAHGGDRNGCADMVSALVDPLMFPLVYGRTRVFQQGGTVALDAMLESYSAAQEAPPAPRPLDDRPARSENAVFSESDDEDSWHSSYDGVRPWSQRYQSLPCEVAFALASGDEEADGAEDANVGVTITSYINGLHPHHSDVYSAIEQVLSRAIRPWNECLVRGHRGLHRFHHKGQLGPVPARIITFGAVWENEMPEWTTAFRIRSAKHEKYWREAYEELQLPPKYDWENEEWSKDQRRAKLRFIEDYFAKPVARELPAPDSDLWQRAKEYLEQPEPPSNITVFRRGNWAIGDEQTWDYLQEKAERMLRFRHPEPGTAFSYREWKEGRHGSRPIVPPKAVDDFVVPPHEGFSVALQDQFREQGLQVIIGVNSIDLTPETPAYAPEIVDREAAHSRWAAKNFEKAEPGEAVSEDMLAWDDDGWQLAGQNLNDHVVAVAMLAFEVDNVTEPRLEFRQVTAEGYPLHRYEECRTPDKAPQCYCYDQDGPAHLIGKLYDSSALAETLGAPWINFDFDSGDYPYQHIGSVGLKQDRLVVFPNVLEHRLSTFRLVDETKPGRIRWLTLSLVDPHYRVCSTRNVPPQQHAWWAREVGPLLATAGKLPPEIIDQILAYTYDWPMGMDEARQHRKEMAQEGGLAAMYT